MREIQEFGAFRLDPAGRRLERTGGETVALGAKPFDALVCLVEHAGEPVSRKALIDAMWPDTVVEENNLTQAVSALRRVLGEGYIVTLPGRGYQFVAEVRSAGRDSRDADARGKSAAPPHIDSRIADRDGRQHSPQKQTVSAENALGPRRAGTLAGPRVPVAARHTVGRERELAEAGKQMVSRPFWRRALPVSDPQAGATPPVRPISRLMLPLTAGLIMGALVVGSLAWILRPESSPATIKRFAHPISEGIAVDSAQRGRSLVALAPDGRSFVYRASDRLYLRPIGQLEARPIRGTEESPLNPFFSPDGQSVAYFAGGALKRISLSGGIPVPIASGVSAPFGASWDSNGTILFGQPQGIFRVSADGGKPELVIRAEQGERLYGPEFLPNGDSVLFSATKRTWNDAQIVVQSLSTGYRTPLVEGGSDAHYVATGHLVYALANGLFAVAFDPESLKVSGRSVSLGVEGVLRAAADTTAAANYGIAADGTLIYLSINSGANPPVVIVWVDRDGNEEPTGLEARGEYGECSNLALAPDGTRFAFDCITRDLQDVDLWTWALAQHTRTRLTSEPGFQAASSWSPDSSRIAYDSHGEGLFVRAAEGTGMPQQLLEGDDLIPWDWLDDDELIFTELNDSSNVDIGMLALTGDQERRALLNTKFNERRPAVSPDGRWLAYQSDESGQYEIYVRPFPNVDAHKWPVSSGGGEEPRWSGDGRTLFFLGPRSLMETTVTTVDADAPFTHALPEAVLDRDAYLFPLTPRRYDVSPDGQRFLLTRYAAAGVKPAKVVIVENWVEELKRRVPKQ